MKYSHHVILCNDKRVAVECAMTSGEETATKAAEFLMDELPHPVEAAYDRSYEKCLAELGLGTETERSDEPHEDATPAALINSMLPEVDETEDAETQTQTVTSKAAEDSESELTDDTVILLGPCVNHTYGEVKLSSRFNGFLKWLRCTKTDYGHDPRIAAQVELLRAIPA